MEVAPSVYYNGDDLDLEYFFLLCLIMACLNGSNIFCMLVMVSRVLMSVEYLHSMSCRHLLPLYVVSSTSCPWVILCWGVVFSPCRCVALLG